MNRILSAVRRSQELLGVSLGTNERIGLKETAALAMGIAFFRLAWEAARGGLTSTMDVLLSRGSVRRCREGVVFCGIDGKKRLY
jgi:hypothetical protein